MAQQTGNDVIAENFGAPSDVYDRFVRAAEGFYAVTEAGEGKYDVFRDGSDNTYRVDVAAMECSCGDTNGACKHLWRAIFETGELPAIDGNAAVEAAADDADAGQPVLTDAEYEAVERTMMLKMDDVAAGFEPTAEGVRVETLDADARSMVRDGLKMYCRRTNNGPQSDAELAAAHAAMDKIARC